MNKLETCHHCGEEKENCYHGFIAMCIPIPKAEEKKEKWNLIDAYENYDNQFNSRPNWGELTKEDYDTQKLWGKVTSIPGIDGGYPWTEKFTQEEFNNKIKTDPEFSKKWFTKTWWKGLERTDLTEEEMKELDDLTTYDQLLNTVGRGVQCDDCGKKEAELYEKYYPKSLES